MLALFRNFGKPIDVRFTRHLNSDHCADIADRFPRNWPRVVAPWGSPGLRGNCSGDVGLRSTI